MLQNYYIYDLCNYSNTNFIANYKQEEKGGFIETKIDVPGIKKKQIALTYNEEWGGITIHVDDKSRFTVSHNKRIDPDETTAELSLGILTIKAKVKNTDKHIPIL